MNMQNLMREAQKMQAELTKVQSELEKTIYEGTSSMIKVKVNGKKEIIEIKISDVDVINKEDFELFEDMIVIAINDAMNKVNQDKEKKLGKYSNSLSGLM